MRLGREESSVRSRFLIKYYKTLPFGLSDKPSIAWSREWRTLVYAMVHCKHKELNKTQCGLIVGLPSTSKNNKQEITCPRCFEGDRTWF